MIKKNLKLIIPIASALFSLILFLILFFNIPRVTYEYNENYDAYFVDKTYGNAKTYEIKSTHKDKPVIGINSRAFYKQSRLKEIILPDSIIIIERLAFSECENLEAINLENVDVIYRNAFSYCYKLNNLKITAKDIGASAFFKCLGLSEIALKDGVETIGSMAFAHTTIQNIAIPRSVKRLENDCFIYCYALKNINVYGSNLKDNSYLKSLAIVTYIG